MSAVLDWLLGWSGITYHINIKGCAHVYAHNWHTYGHVYKHNTWFLNKRIGMQAVAFQGGPAP